MSSKKKTTNKIKTYFNKIVNIIKEPEINILPGQLAFFIMLSLVPMITLACFAANIFEFDYTKIIVWLNQFVPGGVDYLLPNIEEFRLSIPMVVVLIWMFYIASAGCNTIILIANEIYGIRQSNWLIRRIKALFMTLMIVILVIFLLLISVYEVKLQGLFTNFNHGEDIYSILTLFKVPIMFIVLLIFLRFFYNFAPDRMRKNTHINIGTIFTAVGWTVVTVICGILTRNLVSYEFLYGGLANIAILMLWIYFISFIFVIGLALNYGEEVEENKK